MYAWKLRKLLFRSLVLPVLLYGVPAWGPATSTTGWKRLEAVQKTFLQHELGVRPQIPYLLLLAEVGWIPVEAHALFLTLQYVQRSQTLGADRLPLRAWRASQTKGWGADVCRWAARWGLQEIEWPSLTWTSFVQTVSKFMWRHPMPRMQYYLRDVNPLLPYREKEYLVSQISVFLRHKIAQARLSSHNLRVEEGRWIGLERLLRTCRFCDSGSI